MDKIPDWATAKHDDFADGVEVRLNGDGTIDEVLVNNADFHLEQMDDGQYWIGLSWTNKDGEEQRQCLMLTRHGKHIFPTLFR